MSDSQSRAKVDTSILNSTVFQNMPTMNAKLGADQRGVFLKDATTGTEIAGSIMYWDPADGTPNFGISGADWNSNSGVGGTYTYTFNDGQNYDVTIKFSLLDETDKETAIRGIDGVAIHDPVKEVNNDVAYTFTRIPDSGITSGTKTSTNTNDITIEEEVELGRDFDTPMQSGVYNNGELTYNNGTFYLIFIKITLRLQIPPQY